MCGSRTLESPLNVLRQPRRRLCPTLYPLLTTPLTRWSHFHSILCGLLVRVRILFLILIVLNCFFVVDEGIITREEVTFRLFFAIDKLEIYVLSGMQCTPSPTPSITSSHLFPTQQEYTNVVYIAFISGVSISAILKIIHLVWFKIPGSSKPTRENFSLFDSEGIFS